MTTTPGANGVQGITEHDISNYLLNTPGFFERHAELLATVQLTSPHGQRAVSLQERQMEMLRERIKGLEHKIIEMIRNGQDNVAIADRLHQWTMRLLLTSNPAELPLLLLDNGKTDDLKSAVQMRFTDSIEPGRWSCRTRCSTTPRAACWPNPTSS